MRWRPTLYLGRWAGVEIRLDLILVVLIGLLFFSSLRDAQADSRKQARLATEIAERALYAICVSAAHK